MRPGEKKRFVALDAAVEKRKLAKAKAAAADAADSDMEDTLDIGDNLDFSGLGQASSYPCSAVCAASTVLLVSFFCSVSASPSPSLSSLPASFSLSVCVCVLCVLSSLYLSLTLVFRFFVFVFPCFFVITLEIE